MSSFSRTGTSALTLALALLVVDPAFAASDTDTASSGTSATTPLIDAVVLFTTVETMPITLASDIIDSDVRGADDEKIGEVSDIIIDDAYRIGALTVGVGGFLGIDEKYVAIPIDDATFSILDDELTVMTNLTEQDLRDAVNR
jgi:hypothetical protein